MKVVRIDTIVQCLPRVEVSGLHESMDEAL